MSLKVFTVDQKIDILDRIVDAMRKNDHRDSTDYAILVSVARDLRARRDLARNNTLGSLEREVKLVIAGKHSGSKPGYVDGHLIHLGNMVVSRWPTISQALEAWGEESAE